MRVKEGRVGGRGIYGQGVEGGWRGGVGAPMRSQERSSDSNTLRAS